MAALDELDRSKEEHIPLAAYIRATDIRSRFQRSMHIYGKVHSGVNRGDNLDDGELENIGKLTDKPTISKCLMTGLQSCLLKSNCIEYKLVSSHLLEASNLLVN